MHHCSACLLRLNLGSTSPRKSCTLREGSCRDLAEVVEAAQCFDIFFMFFSLSFFHADLVRIIKRIWNDLEACQHDNTLVGSQRIGCRTQGAYKKVADVNIDLDRKRPQMLEHTDLL